MITTSIDPFLDVIRAIHLTTGNILNGHDTDAERAIRLVCGKFGLSKAQLFRKSKKERFVLPRWCLFRVLHKRHTPQQIAELVKFDRHTVAHGLHRLAARLETEPKLRKELAWLENGAV